MIGAAIDNEGSLERVGAAWIFTRSGSTWAQRGAKFRGGAGRGENGRFGASVALSADSKTALIGEDGEDAAWVFASRRPTRTLVLERERPKAVRADDRIGRVPAPAPAPQTPASSW